MPEKGYESLRSMPTVVFRKTGFEFGWVVFTDDAG